ncbi:MAG: M50 family metallopeptidase [Cellulosilyticaceae bacterium]
MIAKILMIVLMFALIVLIHEWGHYIAAKKMGVRVNEFAIGMGPKLWSKQKGETLYSIRALPIGGFCAMEGEGGESDSAGSMTSKSPIQRFIIFVAGAAMNFLLAWLLLTLFIGYRGYGTNKVEIVQPNMPAAAAGLQVGDTILAVDNAKVKDLEDITSLLNDSQKTYTFSIRAANGESKILTIKPIIIEDGSAKFGFIAEKSHSNVLRMVKDGLISTFTLIEQVFTGFIQIITGQVAMTDLAGIVGVVQVSSDVWNEAIQYSLMDAIMQMVYISALLSANLAVLNLLPLPALDGGRIVFTLIELVRGKPVSPEKEGMVHTIGFIMLMGLMVVVLYNDIVRIIK